MPKGRPNPVAVTVSGMPQLPDGQAYQVWLYPDDGTAPELIDVGHARILHPDSEDWIPESWSVLEATLVATPLRSTDMTMIVARVGGPDFLASEVEHLGALGTIVGELVRPKA